jgi:urease accessory protein
VLVLGLMVVAGNRLAVSAGVALCGLFAMFHGHAHASEATGGVYAYIIGFSIATAFIHVTGIGIGKVISQNRLARFAVGEAVTAAGAYILAGL